jgi:hypothetical protein
MKSKRIKYIFITIFIVLSFLAIILPYKYRCFFHSENEPLTIIVIVITAIATILTFLIAVLLYEKLGIERVLQEKATLTVIDLLDFLRSNTLSVFNENFMLNISMFDTLSPYFKQYYSWKVAFSITVFDALEPLQKYGNSLLIDKKIAEKVQLLKPGIVSFDIDNGKRDGYVQIRVLGTTRRDGEQYGRLEGNDMALLTLLQIFDDIKLSAIDWLNKNSKRKFDFNM